MLFFVNLIKVEQEYTNYEALWNNTCEITYWWWVVIYYKLLLYL